MSTALFFSLLALGGILVGIKIYLQDKDEKAQEAAESIAVEGVKEKAPEQVVADRLAEIATFEAQIAEEIVEQPKVKKKSPYRRKHTKPKSK